MALKEYVGETALARFLVKLTAKYIGYDNSSSGMEAENVQDAVDELNSNLVGFIDIGNLLYTFTTYGETWTATEDCIVIIALTSSTNSLAYVTLDGVRIMEQPSGGAYSRHSFYVKMGSVIATRNTSGQSYSGTAYGLTK